MSRKAHASFAQLCELIACEAADLARCREQVGRKGRTVEDFEIDHFVARSFNSAPLSEAARPTGTEPGAKTAQKGEAWGLVALSRISFINLTDLGFADEELTKKALSTGGFECIPNDLSDDLVARFNSWREEGEKLQKEILEAIRPTWGIQSPERAWWATKEELAYLRERLHRATGMDFRLWR